MMIPEKVHLVGSIGLDNVSEVFRTAGGLLGRRLQRIPDGEPGGRRLWISWQYPLLRSSPFLKVDPDLPREPETGFPFLCIENGVSPGEVHFGELGYAHEARASYQLFLAARDAGEIPPGVRFQVSLPTPLAVIGFFCPGKDESIVERVYEEAMMREVDSICSSIPHQDLCIQWDVCIEMLIWDGQMKQLPVPFKDIEGEIAARMKRICEHVPGAVQLGIHLCYGDWQAKHFVEPLDASKMVGLANLIARTVSRPINYIHMPVPIDRIDEAFYRPLRDLKLDSTTELYLGLVHRDGAAGTRKRIETAEKFVADFGIATECGMARQRSAGLVKSLLQIHADSSNEPARAI